MKDKSVLRAAFERHPVATMIAIVMPFGFVAAAIAALVKMPRQKEAQDGKNSDRARG